MIRVLLAVFLSIHIHACVCLLVISWTKFYYFAVVEWCVWCWFQLQFPHRLHCSTKFQCEINNNHCIQTQKSVKPKKIVCLHFKMQEKNSNSSSSINFYLHIERCWQTVDRLMCAREKDQKLFIISCFFLPSHSASASKKVLTNYNYHLRTTTASLCTLLRRKIPFLLPKFKRAHLQWKSFQIYFRMDLSVIKKLLFSHPYHSVKFDCASFSFCRRIFLANVDSSDEIVFFVAHEFLSRHFVCDCLLCVCTLV